MAFLKVNKIMYCLSTNSHGNLRHLSDLLLLEQAHLTACAVRDFHLMRFLSIIQDVHIQEVLKQDHLKNISAILVTRTYNFNWETFLPLNHLTTHTVAGIVRIRII